MAIFKFSNFVFDSENYRLLRNGKRVDMRPKALRLLCLLIENRERVVSKAEIFSFVWGQTHTRDHLLFQLVSELRRAPFETEFVRTQPNEGYRWNVSTKVTQKKIIPTLTQLAASLAFGLVLAAASYFVLEPKNPAVVSALLPAHSAFSKGVVAMQEGETTRAIEWFTFALKENPDSIESSLFLAQAFMHQNRYEESSERLYTLLSKPGLSSYNTMTANDLLSRVHQRQGSLNKALRFALQSSQEDGVAQCSVDMIEGRVDALLGQLSSSPEPKQTVASSAVSIDSGDVSATERYADQCKQLKQELEETSFCPPSPGDELYVHLIDMDPFKLS